jgi:hypothetical protein
MRRSPKAKRIAARLGRGSRPGSRPDLVGSEHVFRGKRKKTGGRRAGTPNVLSKRVKEAVIEGVAEYGADGHGLDGLKGYVRRAAADPRLGIAMLRAVLPLQAKAEREQFIEEAFGSVEELQAKLREYNLPETIYRLEFHPMPAGDSEKVLDGECEVKDQGEGEGEGGGDAVS